MIYRIAVGTRDSLHVTEHFGQCRQFQILDIDQETGSVLWQEIRLCHTPEDSAHGCGNHSDQRIGEKMKVLEDCQIVLVARMGNQSEKLLLHHDMIPLQFEGTIEAALVRIKKAYKTRQFIRKA